MISENPQGFHKELTNVNIVPITALHLSQNPWCKKIDQLRTYLKEHAINPLDATASLANCHHFKSIFSLFFWLMNRIPPYYNQILVEVEVSLTLTASCDCKNRSHEVVQSSRASLLLCESAEELMVLPFPPKRYTPDMSWNNQHIDMDSNSKRTKLHQKPIQICFS